jgi:hypothetical protein
MSDTMIQINSILGFTASGQMAATSGAALRLALRQSFGAQAPALVVDITSELQLPASIPAGQTWTSPVLPSTGLSHVAMGVKSTQGGTLTVQPYLDNAGLITAGSPQTAALSANTAQTLDHAFTTLFQSFTVAISNSGAAPATQSNVIALLGSV